MYRSRYNVFLAATVLVSLFVASACFPAKAKKKLQDFADAVDIAMLETVSVYLLIEATYDRRNREKFANTYDPNTDDPNRFNFNRFIPEDDWKARKLVIDGLRQYAANLKAVVSDDSLEEFDGRTKALGQQLVGIQSSFVKAKILKSNAISDSEIRIFTTALNTIGRWFIDYRRKKVIRRTVSEMRSAVRNACNIFAKEIGGYPLIKATDALDSSQNPTLRKKLWRDYSDLLRLKNDFIRRHLSSFSPSELRGHNLALLEIIRERETSDKALAAVVETLRTIPIAHDNIEKSFDEGDTSFPQLVARIFEEVDRIRDFHESLKK
jgi:hypothetical protein